MERKWWTLAAVVGGVFMLVLDVTIVNVALPAIGADFHAPLTDLQWVIDAYALALAAGLLTGGSLGDLWGRRRLYAVGTVMFTACSVLCGLSTGPLFLALARTGQGIGGAVVWATSLALLSDAFRGRDRGMAFGIYGAVLGLAVGAGPLLGGVLTSSLSWRWIFWVNLPVGIAVVIITVTKLRESSIPRAPRPDWPGFAVFTAALVLLVYGLISAAGGWGQPKVYATLAAGAVLLAAFPFLEVAQRHPMLDLAIFRKPTFNGGLIAAIALNGSIYALLTYLVIYLQQQLGYSPEQTGVRFLALTGAMFVASTVAGRLTNAVSARVMISAGFAAVGAGTLMMAWLTASSGYPHLLPGMIVAGAGAGLVTVPLASTAVGVVDVSRAGTASGMNATARQVGLAAGVAALGAVLTTRTKQAVATQLAHTALAGQAAHIASGVGASSTPAASVPPGLRPAASRLITQAVRAGFADGLNEILIIGATVAFAAALLSLLLIRARDFVPPPMSPMSPMSPASSASSASPVSSTPSTPPTSAVTESPPTSG
jgi:EmrB/QacA subfamily drug resistance transporter